MTDSTKRTKGRLGALGVVGAIGLVVACCAAGPIIIGVIVGAGVGGLIGGLGGALLAAAVAGAFVLIGRARSRRGVRGPAGCRASRERGPSIRNRGGV